MSRRLFVVLGALALMLAALVPAVGAETTVTDNPVKVEKGAYDSYVVVMRAEPLLASFDKDALNTSRAKTARAELRATHDRTLRGAGIDDGTGHGLAQSPVAEW